jgi:predicted alpha/beta hydrolase family esterase
VVPSSGGGAAVRAPQPLAAAGQPPPQQQRRRQRPMRVVVRASKEDEMIERMKREAAGNDIWGNEVVSIVFKVGCQPASRACQLNRAQPAAALCK